MAVVVEPQHLLGLFLFGIIKLSIIGKERGVSKDMNGSEVTCYPYEYSKELDCWVNISGKVTLSSYRAGYKNGTKRMK